MTSRDTGYYLRVMATYTDAPGFTDMDMDDGVLDADHDAMGAEAGDTLVSTGMTRMTTTRSTWIEVFTAIDDYFDYDDRLTLEEVLEIVDLYFEFES